MDHDISAIISSALAKPIVQLKCTLAPNLSMNERNLVEHEISRMLGYCILFKTSDGIEEYMQLSDINSKKI